MGFDIDSLIGWDTGLSDCAFSESFNNLQPAEDYQTIY